MDKTHRVRTLLRFLNYGDLRKRKVIPDQPLFTKISKGGKYYPISKKFTPSEYGCFMENVVCLLIDTKSGPDNLKELSKQLKPEIRECFNPLDYSELSNITYNHFSDGDVDFDAEWERGPIQGHPDIVYKDTVYEIKTTGNFGSMRITTILQLLSYFCLAQLVYPDHRIKKIGLVLPLQFLVITIDLENWDWEPFWEELKACVMEKEKQESLSNSDFHSAFVFQCSLRNFVGTHINKEKLFSYVTGFKRPLQFFVGGRSTSKINLSDKFKKELKEKILSTKIEGKYNTNYVPVFIHAPYCLNISNPWGNFKRDEDDESLPWTYKVLGELLNIGKECYLQGIVVHVGTQRTKEKKITKDGTDEIIPPMKFSTAITNMYDSVVNIGDKYATESCPLLIETPAGETGETLCEKEEFVSFFMSLPKRIRSKVKVCVDTCHVFACGYEPMEYISYLYENNIEISLIHYNDSFHTKGSRKDKHAPPLQGYIGLESLSNVLDFAIKHKIPCVTE